MNKDQARGCLPLIQALAEGKTIQFKTITDTWVDLINPSFESSPERYRVKPAPTLRPWRQEEVPIGHLCKNKCGVGVFLIVAAGPSGVALGSGGTWQSFQQCLDERLHSIDGGKTWLPCGVEEAQ